MAYIKNGKKQYTLKEKYKFYKNKAENQNLKDKNGKPVCFTSRVGLATKANSIKRKMYKNKKRFDAYTGSLTINVN